MRAGRQLRRAAEELALRCSAAYAELGRREAINQVGEGVGGGWRGAPGREGEGGGGGNQVRGAGAEGSSVAGWGACNNRRP